MNIPLVVRALLLPHLDGLVPGGEAHSDVAARTTNCPRLGESVGFPDGPQHGVNRSGRCWEWGWKGHRSKIDFAIGFGHPSKELCSILCYN